MAYSHPVLNQALSKYQYLGKQDRSLDHQDHRRNIEHLIQIDAGDRPVFQDQGTKAKAIDPTLSDERLLRSLYMDRIPDSAVCNEAVKLAGNVISRG